MGRPRPSAPRQFRRRGSTARTGEQDDLLPLRLESKRSSPLRLEPSPGRRPPTDTSRRAVLARGQSPCLIHGTEAMTANCDKGPPRPARRDLTARDVGGDSSTSTASSGCKDGGTGPPAGRPVAVRCRANRPQQDSAQQMNAITAETSPKTKLRTNPGTLSTTNTGRSAVPRDTGNHTVRWHLPVDVDHVVNHPRRVGRSFARAQRPGHK